MNILDNYTPTSLLLRPFISAEKGHKIAEFDAFPLRRAICSDPAYKQLDAYQSGYELELTIVTCADLREEIEQNFLFEVAFTNGTARVLQFGDWHGLRISSVLPPDNEGRPFVYTFTTVRPNEEPYIFRTYQN